MKQVFAVLLIIVVGIALGIGVAALRIKTSPWNPALDEGGPAAGPSSTKGDKPRARIAQVGGISAAARFVATG